MGLALAYPKLKKLYLQKFDWENKQLDNVEIYNENATGPIAFNIKGVFSQDAASLFNSKGISNAENLIQISDIPLR